MAGNADVVELLIQLPNYLNFSIENFVKVCLQVLAPLAKIHFWSFRLDILTHDALLSRKGGLPKTSRPPPLLLSSKLPHCPAPGGKNEENEKWWNYEKINAHLKKALQTFACKKGFFSSVCFLGKKLIFFWQMNFV